MSLIESVKWDASLISQFPKDLRSDRITFFYDCSNHNTSDMELHRIHFVFWCFELSQNEEYHKHILYSMFIINEWPRIPTENVNVVWFHYRNCGHYSKIQTGFLSSMSVIPWFAFTFVIGRRIESSNILFCFCVNSFHLWQMVSVPSSRIWREWHWIPNERWNRAQKLEKRIKWKITVSHHLDELNNSDCSD